MNYEQVIRELSARKIHTIKLGLDRIKSLLQKLGNPERGLKYIHVAGTNGKGSTCAMVSNILILQGYNVGMYISPALFSFTERFRINNKTISEQELVSVYEEVKPYITDETFFEVITAMAFVYFKQNNVDIAVLEVGLGGRLDATNIIEDDDVLVSIITNIGLDHVDILGSNVKAIAREKAGIIKKNIPVVTGASGKALLVIKEKAQALKAPVMIAKKTALRVGLYGEHQKRNAGLAVEAVKVLRQKGIAISEKNMIKGIATVQWSGRMQFIAKNILIDCAHNLPGITAMLYAVKNIMNEKHFNNIILIYGSIQRPEINKVVALIETMHNLKTIILSQSTFPKAMTVDNLEKLFSKKTKKITEVNEAIKYAQSIAQNKDLILITGSCYLVGDIKINECNE
ncbi:bifunctional folylpolyglutamate synthase/dihydrofolate synthase [Candidatus Woesearchaeota archaeon]|nr:bifunctional folylpolyglutamate synthase/dihydrofolate synthase [Candidatus Woesearchaeota archaeon]